MPRFRTARHLVPRRDPPPLPHGGLAGRAAPGQRPGLRRTLSWLLASLLLHGLLVLYLVARPREIEELPPPSIDIVFEGGQEQRSPDEPPPGLDRSPGSEASQAANPPASPPESPPPTPPPESTRPLAETPRPPPTPDPLQEEEPPAPPPPAPAPPQPASRPPDRLALPPGVIWAPGGVSLGQAGRQGAAPGRPGARGLDFTVDPRILQGEASADPNLRVTGAQVGADWRAAFRRWLDQNIGYPHGALRNGESGTVRVRVVAGPDGRVRSVRLVGPSGSPSLNFGTTFPFSGAQLPSFPPPADPEGVTIDLTVNYILIRR